MAAVRTIDTHAHILADETMRLIAKEAPKLAPVLQDSKADVTTLTVGSTPYAPFPRGGWDIERRLKDMDEMLVDVQVLSATPQTYYYDQEPALGAALAAIQNEQIAKHVKDHPDRFVGIATLPLQDPERAAAELRRGIQELGLRGAMIGSNCEGKNLDDPSFEVLWQTAQELDAFIFIHPVTVAGANRLRDYYLRNFIGNPLDTTIAAACLVFGGVLEKFPKLTVVLAHGGGFVPYQMGRWVHGWKERHPEPQVRLKVSPQASLDRLRFDTILHARPQLESLVGWVGAPRVLLGTDYPYDMAMMDPVRHVRSLSIPQTDKDIILGAEAAELLAKPQRHVKKAAAE
ncbi:MAG: amidohydrolase family protein [Variibacter sp.]|nr:amidohydrolase family protein [Variibacter sp.]